MGAPGPLHQPYLGKRFDLVAAAFETGEDLDFTDYPEADKALELLATYHRWLVSLGWAPQPVTTPAPAGEPGLPPEYMLAKLAKVVPMLQEARDALTALTELQRRVHGISPTLAARMDEAGFYSLDDWRRERP